MQFEARMRLATKLYSFIQRRSKRVKQQRNAPMRKSYTRLKSKLHRKARLSFPTKRASKGFRWICIVSDQVVVVVSIFSDDRGRLHRQKMNGATFPYGKTMWCTCRYLNQVSSENSKPVINNECHSILR